MIKTKFMLIIVMIALPLLAADRVLVNFYSGGDTNLPPKGWPSATAATTNTALVEGWSTNMSVADYKALRRGRLAAYSQWSSNLTWSTVTFQRTNNAAKRSLSNRSVRAAIRGRADIKAYVESLNGLEFQILTRKVIINILLEKQKQLNEER